MFSALSVHNFARFRSIFLGFITKFGVIYKKLHLDYIDVYN